MRVIAKAPEQEVYLILAEDDVEAALKQSRPVARVLDLHARSLSKPANAVSVLTAGAWDEVEIPDAQLQEWLARVERTNGTAIDEPWLLPSQRARLEREQREAQEREAAKAA